VRALDAAPSADPRFAEGVAKAIPEQPASPRRCVHRWEEVYERLGAQARAELERDKKRKKKRAAAAARRRKPRR